MAHLYQDSRSICGDSLSGSRADYEGFRGGLLKESRGGLDSFAGEKGAMVLSSVLGCGKGDLYCVIAFSSLAVLWPYA